MEKQNNPIQYVYNKKDIGESSEQPPIPSAIFWFSDSEQQNKGPFSLEQLLKENLQRNTPVWFKGLEYWIDAEDLVFLQDYFEEIPPIYKKVGFRNGV